MSAIPSHAELREAFRQNLSAPQVFDDAALVPLPAEFLDLLVALAPAEMDEHPLNARHDEILRTMRTQPAEGVAGLLAKARFLQILEAQKDIESAAGLGWSLAADLIRLFPTGPPV